MAGTFTARNAVLLLLAVLALGAGLLWWLFNHRDLTRTTTVQPKPPAQAERSAAPAEPESLSPKSITEATEAIKDLGTQIGVAKPAAPQPGPQFDVARIEQNGDSVIAGRATPNATVELLRDGEVHDSTVADSTGAFVLVPKPLPQGKYDLKLRATEPGGKQTVSGQTVAVELGSPAQEKAVATISPGTPAAAPQKPAAPSDAPAAQQKPAPQGDANVRIDLAEAQEGGKLYISGRSAPGANVRLYLNDAFIAAGTAAADGQISFFIGGGVKPGQYRIRLDQLGASDKVVARAEVPFSAPTSVASRGPAAPAPGASAPQASVAVLPQTSAPPPQPSAAPGNGGDAKSSPQTQVERPAAPQAAGTAPAGAPQVAPDTRIAAGGPAAPGSSPQQRSATPAVTQTPPSGTAPAAAPRDLASATPGPAESMPSPASSTPAAKDSASPQKSAAATGRKDAVVVPNINTKVVIRGDNLWQISRNTYGDGIRYTVIYRANRDQIRDPDLIYPGQIFVLPRTRP